MLAAVKASLTAAVIPLVGFKDYVHFRLDGAGVAIDPDSPHKAEGCRIGGRLDVLIGQRDELLRHVKQVLACMDVTGDILGDVAGMRRAVAAIAKAKDD